MTTKLRQRKPSGGQHGGYGWVPDLPDHRDRVFEPDMEALKRISQVSSADLSSDAAMPSIWDQGQLGSCTAHSVGATFYFAHVKSGHDPLMPARLWIYYQERVIEGTVGEDAGAEIRDGFKVCGTVGVPPEDDWPYDISTFATAPSQQADTDAVLHKDLTYAAVAQEEDAIKATLLGPADGKGDPVSFGFSVYESFESREVAETGIVPMPKRSEAMVGGHAVVIVGFDDEKKGADGKPGMWKVRNSWSDGWGDHGFFWMPYHYALDPDLADDFWQVSVAS